jgi:AraC-like DNA-binding protein
MKPMETMIRAATLTGYFQVARRHGLNPLELMRQVELDTASLLHPDQRIPVSSACRLLEISAQRSGCSTFGLEMAELRQKFDVGAVGLLLAHKRTLREALMTAVQYRHLLNDALGLYVESGGNVVSIREEVIPDAPTQTRQATELAVAIMARICRALLGQNWKPRSVNFTHPAPCDIGPHRRFFGCPVRFNSDFNGIVCTAADLDLPNPAADPELVRYAESLATPMNVACPDSIMQEVRKAIYLLLPLGQASIKEVAGMLHLSTRTLQRQLNALESDFATLLTNVRHDLAIRYLVAGRHPIGRVAELLAFSRQASFTRWFIAQFGMTPRAWRASHRHAA